MTPDTNERAARILGWKQHSEDDQIWIRPGFTESDFTERTLDAPDFTGPGDAFLQLIACAWEQGWDFSLQRTRKATFEWLAEFTKGDASFSRESNSMRHAITYAFLATFEPEHPAV